MWSNVILCNIIQLQWKPVTYFTDVAWTAISRYNEPSATLKIWTRPLEEPMTIDNDKNPGKYFLPS